VILSQDNTVSVLINEEDHIRAQAILPFYELDAAYKKIDEIDDILEDALDFSYNPRLGYITSCPTNLGTAMRISVMLFLPALTKTKEINKIINEVSKRGFTVRGIYGEGSDAEGFKYQLSNQSSLGLSERQLIAQLDSVAKKICGYEDTARKFLLKNDGVNLKDVIMRSWGILTNAYKLSGEEYIRYSAHVKLGAALGVLHFQDFNRLLKLDGEVMPANMIMKARRKLSAEELEIFRAEYVRAKLENFK
jgi:protein arginine kinase